MSERFRDRNDLTDPNNWPNQQAYDAYWGAIRKKEKDRRFIELGYCEDAAAATKAAAYSDTQAKGLAFDLQRLERRQDEARERLGVHGHCIGHWPESELTKFRERRQQIIEIEHLLHFKNRE